MTGRVWSALRATPRLWLPRRPPVGPLSCRYWALHPAGQRALADPRSSPRAKRPSCLGLRGCAGRRPGGVFIGPYRPARPAGDACGVPGWLAADGGLHAAPPLCHAGDQALCLHQRATTVPLDQRLWHRRPTG
jgi:hypothetical protein